MKKQILNLGKTLSKVEQRSFQGGNGPFLPGGDGCIVGETPTIGCPCTNNLDCSQEEYCFKGNNDINGVCHNK